MRSTWGLGRGKRAAQECNGKPTFCNGKPEKCARMRKNAQENLRALLDILCFMFASMDSQVCLEVFNFHNIYTLYDVIYTFYFRFGQGYRRRLVLAVRPQPFMMICCLMELDQLV